VLNNAETVLAGHLKIEARMAAGNPPELVEQARKTHETFLRFKQWLAQREQANAAEGGPESSEGGAADSSPFPSFHQWLSERESRPAVGP
jgi:hypothetical protein